MLLTGGACSARAKVVEIFLSDTLHYQDLHQQNEGQWSLHSQGDGTDRQMWAHLFSAAPCPFHTETSTTLPEALRKKRNFFFILVAKKPHVKWPKSGMGSQKLWKFHPWRDSNLPLCSHDQSDLTLMVALL